MAMMTTTLMDLSGLKRGYRYYLVDPLGTRFGRRDPELVEGGEPGLSECRGLFAKSRREAQSRTPIRSRIGQVQTVR